MTGPIDPNDAGHGPGRGHAVDSPDEAQVQIDPAASRPQRPGAIQAHAQAVRMSASRPLGLT